MKIRKKTKLSFLYRNTGQVIFSLNYSYIRHNLSLFLVLLRERSHMTSAAEGGGGFEMLTVPDKGEGV